MQTPAATGSARFAYVGAYTPSGAEGQRAGGISIFAVAPDGVLSLVQTVPSANPTFLALSPDQRVLYAVNEIDDYQGRATGSVEAYAVNPETGGLTLINREDARGTGPAHITVDPAGRCVVVANYGGGTFAVLPIRADGGLDPATDTIVQRGSGPDPERQEAPHPHGVTLAPRGDVVVTADLGIDRVQTFRLNVDRGDLEPLGEAATTPGGGPRHVAFHPGGRLLYVINELDATLQIFPYDPDTGRLGEALQTVSTLPENHEGPRNSAEFVLHPSGRFAFGSNRRLPGATAPAADSIATFDVDPDSGFLTPLGHTTEGINFPRHIAFDPTGTRLYACNQLGDTIVQFTVDPDTGALDPTGTPVETPLPVCIAFMTS
jgi:6-phosphogluconolactonase (cycloisomerase 2 family)